jgi:D-threonate/D-erythronate kinase
MTIGEFLSWIEVPNNRFTRSAASPTNSTSRVHPHPRARLGQRVQIGIVADDLTSAADGGIPFVRAGLRSVVTLNCAHVTRLAHWPVVAVDTDSRAATPTAAAASITASVGALRDRELLYKTIDSTIRGHVAVELRAAQLAGGRSRTVLAPAFPANGRFTRGGRQFLYDAPLAQTPFARDPQHPVGDDDIASVLASGGVEGVRILSRGALRDPDSVNAALDSASCVVADAETEEDLERLVRVVSAPHDVLWVGSPGLARALAACLISPGQLPPHSGSAGRLLVAVGSLNPISRQQLRTLLDRVPAALLEIDSRIAMEDPCLAAQVALDAADATDLARASTVVVTSDSRRVAEYARTVHIAEAIARVVAGLHDTRPFDGFVLTGGDTALSVVRRLGVTGIELEAELSPGVVLGTFTGGASASVLTKAGGFGGDDELVRACRYLRGEEAQ